MDKTWYLQIAGDELGPLSDAQLTSLARQGRITPEDLIRKGPDGKWVPARRVRGLFTAQPAVAEPQGQQAHQPAAPPAPPTVEKRGSEAPSSASHPREGGTPPSEWPLHAQPASGVVGDPPRAARTPSLVTCPTCQRHISSHAKSCPNCGHTFARPSKGVTVLLALLLGSFGAHKFYLGRPGIGVLYLLFCWTYIPGIIGILEGLQYLFISDEKFVDLARAGRSPEIVADTPSGVGDAIRWTIGALFILVGATSWSDGRSTAPYWVLLGALLLPPTWRWIASRLFPDSAASRQGWIASMVIAAALLVHATAQSGPDDDYPTGTTTVSSSTPSSTPPTTFASSAGNRDEPSLLHRTALDWQRASYDEKLVTCRDMIASLWLANVLKPSMQRALDSEEKLNIYSDRLVKYIDVKTRKEANEEMNRRNYQHIMVRYLGTMGVEEFGWLD